MRAYRARHMSADEKLELIAATAFGVEAVAARELTDLGFQAKAESTGRVVFAGDQAAVAKANLWLRSADRVLVRVGGFDAPDFDALYERTMELPWERWIPREFAFPVSGRSVKSQLTSVPAVQRTVKKAIVQRLLRAHHTRALPESGPEVAVEISLLENRASLTVDTSGVGLHKRGYRPEVGPAAMKETLAAALVLLSGWKAGRPFLDPFCGTGTIAVEAALWARNMAPGLGRLFAAEQWPAIDERVWREARQAAQDVIKPSPAVALVGADIDVASLGLAHDAIKRAGLVPGADVRLINRPFEKTEESGQYGSVVTNPPYGVRLGGQDAAELDALYRQMPLVLRRLPTWSFHIITGRLDLERLFGQEASRRRKLYNAQIQCTYFSFFGPRPPREGVAVAVGAGVGEAGGGGDEAVTDAGTAVDATGAEAASAAEAGGAFASAEVPAVGATPAGAPAVAPAAFGGLSERDRGHLDQFAKCLANNARHLRKWPSRGITCYRIYDRDVADVPLIIDRYEDRVHAVEYERPHERTFAQHTDFLEAAGRAIAEVLGIPAEHVYLKPKRRQRGLSQHERLSERGETIIAHEGGLKFEVNLTDYVDTGLFLDHRQTREMVRASAAGKRMLNLFCYTGSFSMYAAAGGAKSTTSVDLSNTYLDWAERNFTLNKLWSDKQTLVRGDVMAYLAEHERVPGGSYDLVVVDPPTFSNSKSTEEDWEVAAGHVKLLRLLRPLLSDGALVWFSNNYRRFKLDEAVVAELGLRAQEISHRTVPPDFRNKRIHRCWRMVVGGAAGGAGGEGPAAG